MKVNKKGFTLVELLAVIVILALLIVIVANTAIPAMNNAKQSALNTYAQKVVQKAKENCAAEKMAGINNSCKDSTGTAKSCCGTITDISLIMGETNDTYSVNITVNYDSTSNLAKVTAGGTIKDIKNNLTYTTK